MRLALLGYFGFGNAGDEALLAAQTGALRARCADAELRVISGDPAHTERVHGLQAVGRTDVRGVASSLRWCDALVAGSGSLLQDATSGRPVAFYGGLMVAARRMRRLVVCYAQGIGPIRIRANELLAGAAMRACAQVTVRDEASAALARRLGAADPVVVGDPALALVPSEAAERTRPRPRVAVALRPWPGLEESLDAVVAALTDVAAEADLVLVPMHAGQDLPLARDLAGRLPAGRVRVARHDGGYRSVTAELQHADAVLGMRLHALVLAAAAGVPIVPLSYDPKVDAFAAAVGVPVAGHVGGRLDAGAVSRPLRRALRAADADLAAYRRAAAALAATATRPADALVAALGGGGQNDRNGRRRHPRGHGR